MGNHQNQVQGNYIGTNASGTGPVSNQGNGVQIQDSNNTVGGTTPGARNVISGNQGSGVNIAEGSHQVQGNYIGTNASGTGPVPNANGVTIFSSGNTVGGTTSGAGNVISGNNGSGVSIVNVSLWNSVLSNSIFSNGGLGIDLGGNGVTNNDPGDGDSGINNLQNFPVLDVAKIDSNGTATIRGTLNSTPNTTFNVQFFSNDSADPSGYGEGQIYLGQKTDVATNSNGDASFTFSATGVSQGKSITATATSPDNSTSEFSQVVVAQPNRPPGVANDSYSVDEDTTLTVSASDGVLENDTDADRDPLTAVLETAPSHGTLTLNNDGSFAYTPSANYSGPDSFTYKANDGEANSSVATVSITVTPVNDAPTDIALDNASVDENLASGTTVGNFSSTDEESDDTHTYELVSGQGDTDNASFVVEGSTLKTAASFDYEAKSSYSIRVRTTDDGSPAQPFEKTFTISVTNDDEAPSDIALSNTSVDENQPSSATVGELSANDDPGNTYTFTLVPGTGDTDNDSFDIEDSTLKTAASFNYETKSSYSIRVRVADGENQTYEEQFTISINDANETPTDIALSNASVDENQASGATVGSFSSTDEDSGDTHTYSLVSGTGSDDNASFDIEGTTLKTAASFDYEIKNSYSIRVRVTDEANQPYEKQFTISINDANEAPTDIALDNASVEENQPSGTTVGSFSGTDEDSGDTQSYSLVSGQGDTDNASFEVEGATLKTKASFDYETKNSYSIRAQTSDGNGGAFARAFTISVTNVSEVPDTIIDSGPSGYTTSTSATFAFHSDPSGATFECSLDNAAYQSCSSPKSYTRLTQGSHTFEVRAKNAAGTDATPATRTFTVDRTAPDTQITGGPQGATNNAKPTFTFGGTDNPVSNDLQFSHKVDNGAWSSYSSDTSATLGGSAGLSQGSHTFYVRAKDSAGNVDSSPAKRTFTVDTTAPTVQSNVSPTDNATGVSPTTNITATFSEAVDSNSLNTNTVTLVKEGDTNPVSATVTYSSFTKKVTLNPASSLQQGARYIATIKGGSEGAKDAAGNSLAQDKVWSFTVK